MPMVQERTGEGVARSGPPGMPGGLASRLAPPFVLPGEHFAAGLAFLILGAAGLAWVAPDLAAGSFLTPRVVAVTHLFTLGWITLSIFGSLYQFLPVALSEGVRWPRVAHVTFALFVAGLPAFSAGLVLGVPVLTAGGAALFGCGVLLFCGNLAATLARAPRRELTWWSLAAATFYLSLTALLGLALAGNLPLGYLGGARWTAMGVHLHLALAGWVLMVVIGVAHRLLPMFLLSHGGRETWGSAAAWLVAVGVGWMAVFHHAPRLVATWVPATLITLGTISFLVQAASYFRHSVKPRLDPGLRMAGAALVVLGAGLGLGWWVLLGSGAPSRVLAAYGTALILGFSLFVAAHYYKIVPFLVWYHRFGPLLGRQPVPQVAELYSGRAAAAAAVLMTVGFGALIPAVAVGAPGPARAFAMVALVGVLIEAVQMIGLARRRP
jgi:hypothetical protein